MDQVFNIPELLENILMRLPITTVLVNVQRVCKLWRDTVQQSSALQRALYFNPKQLSRSGQKSQIRHVNPYGDLISTKEHSNRTYAFDRADASWRHMLIVQPPVPMRLFRYTKTLRFQEIHSKEILETVHQVFDNLTFGEVEDLMKGSRMDVIVETSSCLYWKTSAFEYEIDELHWTTA
jgi:hypothetical protein